MTDPAPKTDMTVCEITMRSYITEDGRSAWFMQSTADEPALIALLLMRGLLSTMGLGERA